MEAVSPFPLNVFTLGTVWENTLVFVDLEKFPLAVFCLRRSEMLRCRMKGIGEGTTVLDPAGQAWSDGPYFPE